MLVYACIFMGWFVLAGGLAAEGLHPLAMALYPIPVALYWASGMRGRSLGLVAGAGLAAWLSTGSPVALAMYLIAADIGVLMGVACARQWPLGWTVAVVTLVGSALVASGMLVNWQESRKEASIYLSARAAELEKDGTAETSSADAAKADLLRWCDANWPYLSLGMVFGTAFMMTTAVMGWLSARLRRSGAPVPRGSFSEMRVPEWMVWLAIALALMWFADRKWPNEALRIVTWNSAISLAFVYWMNGFSILVYALSVFRVNPFLFYAVIIGLFYSLPPVFCAVGFFDTWWNFRPRFARAAEIRFSRPPEDKET